MPNAEMISDCYITSALFAGPQPRDGGKPLPRTPYLTFTIASCVPNIWSQKGKIDE